MPKITLAAARVNKSMTQKELASMLGVSNCTILNWEKGKTVPSIRQLRKISEILEMPMDYIFLI